MLVIGEPRARDLAIGNMHTGLAVDYSLKELAQEQLPLNAYERTFEASGETLAGRHHARHDRSLVIH